MTIGRVMDFVEARLEAIGSQEEEIQSDNDKTVKRHSPQKSQPQPAPNESETPTSTSFERVKEKTPLNPQTTALKRDRSMTPTIHSTSSSPNLRAQPLPLPRRAKGRARSKELNASLSQSSIGNANIAATPFTFSVPDTVAFPEASFEMLASYQGLGKRRHPPELESAFGLGTLTATQGNRSQKRRVKISQGQLTGQQHVSAKMDVEDDIGTVGRERKRVARR
jgi:hypothetical protein